MERARELVEKPQEPSLRPIPVAVSEPPRPVEVDQESTIPPLGQRISSVITTALWTLFFLGISAGLVFVHPLIGGFMALVTLMGGCQLLWEKLLFCFQKK